MYAYIDHNEAERIRHHFRVYFPGNPDVVEDPNFYSEERVPIVVSWSENPPKHDANGYLLFDFDEPGIPSLHILASGDGDDFDGHTYSDILGHEVGIFLKDASKSDSERSGYELLTLFIDNEISYEFNHRNWDRKLVKKLAPTLTELCFSDSDQVGTS